MAEKFMKMNEDGTASIIKGVNPDDPDRYYTISYTDKIFNEIDKIKEDVDKAERKIKKNLWKSGTYNRYGRRRR